LKLKFFQIEKRLALFLWFASALAFAAPPLDLSQLPEIDALRNPQFVVQWLNGAGQKARQEDAKRFFSFGLKAKDAERWSAASKAFGESMIRYPAPHTLLEYNYSHLRMLGEIHARKTFSTNEDRRYTGNALKLYEGSLAANGVTKTLSPQEIQDIEQYISCLKTYLRTSRPQTDCPPTVYFADGKIRKDVNLPTKETTN
jgi:hypothetical protein